MADQRPEQSGSEDHPPTPDPNAWDFVEPIHDFIRREWSRLLPKIPAEFNPTGFKICYVCVMKSADRVDYEFIVSFDVDRIGEVYGRGSQPFAIVMRLIDQTYKKHAEQDHWEEVSRQRAIVKQREDAENAIALQSLVERPPEEIADIQDGLRPLPKRITKEIVAEVSDKIAQQRVRELTDPELIQARVPSVLSKQERARWGQRCDNEYRTREPVRKLLNAHHKSWPVGKDDYSTLLAIWRHCTRQSGTLQTVVTEFFKQPKPKDGTVLTLNDLLRICPEFVKQVRRKTAFERAEAARIRDAERGRRFQPVG
jgi:hypothetical protein